MIKKLFLSVLAAICFSLFVNGALAVIQLDESLRPSNLPSFAVAEEGTGEDNPESRATQTLILFVGNLVSQFLLFAGAITIIFLIVAERTTSSPLERISSLKKEKRNCLVAHRSHHHHYVIYIVRGVIQIILQVDERRQTKRRLDSSLFISNIFPCLK